MVQVYGPASSQSIIFEETAMPIIDAVLQGFNGTKSRVKRKGLAKTGTIFAYGQTGTGKSYTIEGQNESEASMGILPRTFDYIFERILQQRLFRDLTFGVTCFRGRE